MSDGKQRQHEWAQALAATKCDRCRDWKNVSWWCEDQKIYIFHPHPKDGVMHEQSCNAESAWLPVAWLDYLARIPGWMMLEMVKETKR